MGRGSWNYSVYHDRYQHTPDGWRFTERVCEVRYLDTTPPAGHRTRVGRPAGSVQCGGRRQRAAAHQQVVATGTDRNLGAESA
jgi:hypothetical protein